jgi:hypothetical protein
MPPPRCAETEDMQAIEPCLRARMCGMKAWLKNRTPVMLTSTTFAQFSGEISMIFSGWVMPALLMRMSTLPSAAIACSAAWRQLAASATHEPICPRRVPRQPAPPAPGSRMATRAPCCAKSRVARADAAQATGDHGGLVEAALAFPRWCCRLTPQPLPSSEMRRSMSQFTERDG